MEDWVRVRVNGFEYSTTRALAIIYNLSIVEGKPGLDSQGRVIKKKKIVERKK